MKSDYDPLAKETFESPHEDFRRLRSECPVVWSEAFDGFWMLTRALSRARVQSLEPAIRRYVACHVGHA